jgi:hypothetical protein
MIKRQYLRNLKIAGILNLRYLSDVLTQADRLADSSEIFIARPVFPKNTG